MTRRGAAEIEFIMVLPILLMLYMGLAWVGRVSIARATLAGKVRHDAWNARENVRHPPLRFDDTASGIAVASATRTLALADPAITTTQKASASVHGDGWDFSTVDMTRPPDWGLMTTALQAAGENRAGQIATVVGDIRDAAAELMAIRGLLPELDAAVSFFKEKADEAVRSAERMLQEAGGDIDRAIADTKTAIDRADTLVLRIEQAIDSGESLLGIAGEQLRAQLKAARANAEAHRKLLDRLERKRLQTP